MKGIFSLAILAISFFSFNAFSARWIVEDAKINIYSNLSGLKLIKQIKIGNKSYSIVESNDVFQSANQMQNFIFNATQATSVAQDLPVIRLPARPTDQTERSYTSSNPGWHVQKLKYDSLNPNYQGQGIVVAVIDTGVDVSHPNLVNNLWKNPYEIPGNNIDDDSNGYIDDVRGWNVAQNNDNPSDDHGHGTHCAGIIAATPHGATPSRGIAPRAQVMPIRLMGADGGLDAFVSDAIEAIVYASNNGAKILSTSWGFYFTPAQGALIADVLQVFNEAMNYAYYHGVVVVNAVGNESYNLDITNQTQINFPSALPNQYNMIGIASGDYDGSKDKMSYFSNYGPATTHFAAPGSNIMSTILGGGWASMSGTSMATPLFSGALAVVMSKGYTWYEAVNILAQTVDQEAKQEWDGKVRYGLINVEAALQ